MAREPASYRLYGVRVMILFLDTKLVHEYRVRSTPLIILLYHLSRTLNCVYTSYSQPCPRLTTECLERAPTSAPEPGPAPSSTHPVDGSHPVHSHPLCFYRHVTLCRRARRSSAANFYMGSRSLVILIVILQFGHSTFQLRPEAATVIIFIYSTYSIEGKLVHFFNLSDDNMVFNGLVE
ncbi:uncharacterized protein LOC118645636 isoform X2 [Monomorium pharaonis]|uniref:uncharacterized protein LOC118645636 isoform X2 n=1 Tax=Monomorium pharaonis TaxID=307658 RepID=UPI001746EC53|nr:uncharacterized protein LOC118645636 isoform X2 [Monomorium pharaonis]